MSKYTDAPVLVPTRTRKSTGDGHVYMIDAVSSARKEPIRNHQYILADSDSSIKDLNVTKEYPIPAGVEDDIAFSFHASTLKTINKYEKEKRSMDANLLFVPPQ